MIPFKIGPVVGSWGRLKAGPVALNWRHVAAFALVVTGIFSKSIHDALLAGTPISWGWLAGSGIGGAIWIAFEDSILPDIIGGGGSGGGSAGSRPLVFDQDLLNKVPAAPPKPPVSTRDWLRAAPVRMALCSLLLVVSVLTPNLLAGCAAVKQDIAIVAPLFDKIAAIVVAGLQAGELPPQIEADVARALAGQTGVDIVTVVNEVIAFIIDTGVVSGPQLEAAHALQSYELAKITARQPAVVR